MSHPVRDLSLENGQSASAPPAASPRLLEMRELKLALLYVLGASTWVMGTDLVLIHILGIPVESILIHTFKGVNIVATTGVLFYIVLRRVYDRWRRAEKERTVELAASSDRFRSLSAHIQSLREEERTHIAREVHDELGQILTGVKLKIRMVENHLDERDDRSLNPQIEDLMEAAAMIDESMVAVQRISAGLRPSSLDHLGLASALKDEAERFFRLTGIACSVDVERVTQPVPPDIATTVFRVCQESLTNVARHSGGTRVGVECETTDAEIILQVRDNGTGCAADVLSQPSSLGLVGMRERAVNHNGRLTINSAPGAGTTVTLAIPLSGDPQST